MIQSILPCGKYIILYLSVCLYHFLVKIFQQDIKNKNIIQCDNGTEKKLQIVNEKSHFHSSLAKLSFKDLVI